MTDQDDEESPSLKTVENVLADALDLVEALKIMTKDDGRGGPHYAVAACASDAINRCMNILDNMGAKARREARQ